MAENGSTPAASSPGRRDWGTWPVYQAAVLGLRNYWYPVLWSRQVAGKPVTVTLLGERVMLHRDGGTVYALHDRCPHRGVPLSSGSREFPGTITCPYHGWTYRLDTGVLCALLTDGPDSPLTGKVRVRTYPVTERFGLVWVFVGDPGVAVPSLERDLPDDLVAHPAVVVGRIEPGRQANWRFAAENGFDEGHAKFLHRKAVWTGRRRMPVWTEIRIVRSADGQWLSREWTAAHWSADFPEVGHWENREWWQRAKNPKPGNIDPTIAGLELPGMVSVRLPYILRVAYPHYLHYEWAIPEDADHHRYVQLLVSFRTSALSRLWFKLKYLAYIRWAFHGQFTGQDAWAVSVMEIPPERLYRPDISVIEWRKLVEERHR